MANTSIIMEDKQAVILDCGTCFSRAGFSDDTGDSPRVTIPSIVGRPKSSKSTIDRTYFIGEEAVTRKKELNIKFPIEHGHICNWDEMQLMWQHLINDKLAVQAEEHPFLLTQTCNVSSYNLEKMSQIFFETYNVPSLCITPSVVLSVLASEIDTGIAVEIGGGACFCVPILDGYVLRHLQQRTEFSGRDLTYTLLRMLTRNSNSDMDGLMDIDVVNSIKEKYCYCAQAYEDECQLFSKEKEIVHYFKDLNGCDKSVSIGLEQFQCTESLFKPSLSEKEFPGLHEIVFKCLMVEDDVVKKKLASNILLCGGSSFFPGLAPRLQRELENLTESQGCNITIKVVTSPFRHAAFQGAKEVAVSGALLKCGMSKQFYDENGPSQMTKLFRGGY